jgi:hypothetical protein
VNEIAYRQGIDSATSKEAPIFDGPEYFMAGQVVFLAQERACHQHSTPLKRFTAHEQNGFIASNTTI